MSSVVTLCLYGTCETGAGWILRFADGAIIGDGEPELGRTFTSALYWAANEARRRGVKGVMRVFHPGGETYSDVRLDRAIPSYCVLWETRTALV